MIEPDAVIVCARNLRSGMIVCPLHMVANAAWGELAKDPEHLPSSYVNLTFGSSSYSTPGSTLYLVRKS